MSTKMNFSLEALLENLQNLPTLPEVALKVLKLTSDPDSDVNDLHAIIEHDPALTAKLLRVANSSFYGFRNKISTLKMAIVVLGFEETARLVRAFTFLQAFPASKTIDKFDFNRFWLHSIAVSEVSKTMSQQLNHPDPGEVSTAGLLHDIGIIVLATFFEKDFINCINYAAEHSLPWHIAEEKLWGITHSEIGAILASRWNLPESLVDVIRHQYSPGSAALTQYETSLVYLANIQVSRADQSYGDHILLDDHYESSWDFVMSNSKPKVPVTREELLEHIEEDIRKSNDFLRISLA